MFCPLSFSSFKHFPLSEVAYKKTGSSWLFHVHPCTLSVHELDALLQDRVLINQWKDEIISGFKLSAQIMANMNKKVRNKYGADFGLGGSGGNGLDGSMGHPPLEHRNSDDS